MGIDETLLEEKYALNAYTFALPEKLIAQSPPKQRGTSRLMVMKRGTGHCVSTNFSKLIEHLPEKCLLVANNSQVVPARLYGHRKTGGRVECLLLTPLPLIQSTSSSFIPPHSFFERTANDIKNYSGNSNNHTPCTKGTANKVPSQCIHKPAGTAWLQAKVTGLFRSSKKIPVGELVHFSDQLFMQVQEHKEYGNVHVTIFWQGDLRDLITRYGVLPLPPYIQRNHTAKNDTTPHSADPLMTSTLVPSSPETTGTGTGTNQIEQDKTRYQTIYANQEKAGSVAAPTAGLHFTKELQKAIIDSGREWVEATLYVGYGTFSPVRTTDIRHHTMHAEYVELSQETAHAINTAKKENRAIIAIGTTATRILEGVFRAQHTPNSPNASLLEAYQGWINIFLYPGAPFHIIDGLITNFHLPESSLLMLISAFASREHVLQAYQQAIAEDFRFFSYGDAMFITP